MWRAPVIFVLLMVAFALVAPPYASVQNARQDQKRAAYAWESSPVTFVSGQDTVEPKLYKRPCQNTADDRQSDLCAQWKSADWAKLGTVVAAFGIGVLLFQIYLTIRALDHTSKATEAMERQNELAEDTAKRQLRAYIITSTFRVDGLVPGGRPMLSYTVNNVGQTPAYDVYHAAKVFVGLDLKEMSAEKVHFGALPGIMSRTTAGTKTPLDSSFDAFPEGAFTDEVCAEVLAGHIIIGVFGAVSYRDIFKRRHITTFKKMLRPASIKDGGGRLSSCEKGNRAN